MDWTGWRDSPEYANIYLNYLDTVWEGQFTHLGTMVRYADDLVILCEKKAQAIEATQLLRTVFHRLELSMNQEKSKLVSLWIDKPGFDFLGFHHRRMPVWWKGGRVGNILRSFPSRKATSHIAERTLTSGSAAIHPPIVGCFCATAVTIAMTTADNKTLTTDSTIQFNLPPREGASSEFFRQCGSWRGISPSRKSFGF